MSDEDEQLNESQEQPGEPQQASDIDQYLKARTITFKDVLQHMTGPVISIVLHVIIITLASSIIIMKAPEQKNEVQVEMKEMEFKEIPEELKEKVPVTEEAENVDTFVAEDAPQVVTTTVNVEVGNLATGSMAADIELPNVMSIEPNRSALKLTGTYSNRTGAMRKVAVKQYGGTMRTEGAVDSALKWLSSIQNEDGSWGDVEYHKVQLTALAIMAFLANGETPQSEKYGETLLRGLKKVRDWADVAQNGLIHGDLNQHARLCVIIAEAYAVTKIPDLEYAMNATIRGIIRHMNKIGGFDGWYDMKTNTWKPSSNLARSSRMYNALYSAFNAGCEVPGLEEKIELAVKCMEEVNASPKGGFANGCNPEQDPKHKNPDFIATASGTLYVHMMGAGKQSVAGLRGLEWLEDMKVNGKKNSELRMDWRNLPGQQAIVGWYYMTQALFQAYKGKGSKWKQWNRNMTRTLTMEQDPRGFWLCPGDKYPPKSKSDTLILESSFGSFSDLNAKIWATSYFCMMLQVYYTYLPSFKPSKIAAAPENEEDLTL